MIRNKKIEIDSEELEKFAKGANNFLAAMKNQFSNSQPTTTSQTVLEK